MLRKLFAKRPDMSNMQSYLFFFGSGRTGSTLLGQILNMHPQMLIANEYRFLDNLFRHGGDLHEETRKMARFAMDQFSAGLENVDHFKKTLDHFQSKWASFNDVRAAYPKQEIRILGDKKAGGNAQLYLEKKDQVLDFLDNTPALLLQILRNPIDAARSAAKAFNQSFDESLEIQIQCNKATSLLFDRYQDKAFSIHYENLLTDPTRELRKVIGFLGLPVENKWLELISAKVSKGKKAEHSDEEKAKVRAKLSEFDATQVYAAYDFE